MKAKSDNPKERIASHAEAILVFIEGERRAGRFYPTFLELASELGITKGDAYEAVDLLLRQGRIKKLGDRSRRSLRLLHDPYPRPWLHPSNVRYKE